MPLETRMLLKPNETLLDVCLNTRMACNGSADSLSEEDLARNIQILELASVLWRKGLPRYKRFDDAVLELCRATLAEVADSKENRDLKEWFIREDDKFLYFNTQREAIEYKQNMSKDRILNASELFIGKITKFIKLPCFPFPQENK